MVVSDLTYSLNTPDEHLLIGMLLVGSMGQDWLAGCQRKLARGAWVGM